MASGAADEREILTVFEHQSQSPPRLQEMASPQIPEELLLDIFLRLPDPADLVRAAAACVSFRRIFADRYFLWRHRKLHAPPVLGFLDQLKVFHPSEPPYPSASAASAVALAADFSFSFLPAPASDWTVYDIRDCRVLFFRFSHPRTTDVSFDMVVCDPLHRRYVLLPPITNCDLSAGVLKTRYYTDVFLVSPSDGDAAEEKSFRVVWMAMCETRLVAFVFSSTTGIWRAIPSQHWSDLLAGLPPFGAASCFYRRQYAHGCFNWVIHYSEESKLLLNTETMEFSIAEPPPEANGSCDLAMVEAEEGRPGMFLLVDGTSDLSYFIRKNDGGSSSQWQKVKTISLASRTLLTCKMEKYLLLYQWQSSLLEEGCFMLDIETFQLEKVCTPGSNIFRLHAYSNFPPSLLSSPTVSNGIQEDA